jgi:hypothetical protein
MKQRLLRLDRIAGQMNGWLLVIAIGLGMLDLAVLVAKCIPAVTLPSAASGAASHEQTIRSTSQADNTRS